MRSSLKPIYLMLGLVGACSLVNKFDAVNPIPPASAGAGGTGGDVIGEAGNAPTGGTSSAGNGGTGGTGAMGEGGQGGATGEPLTGGVIVVQTSTGSGTTLRNYVVLLDPADGREITRTDTGLPVLAVVYEAARDKWFVFTGDKKAGAGPNGPLLVGSMTTLGFEVEQTAMVPKPTNQTTVAVLNQRILYRTGQHIGAATDDDTFTLLDTSGVPAPLGKMTVPYKDAVQSIAAHPNGGQTAGGRVFFLNDNPDDTAENCEQSDAGTQMACNVYESSLLIAAADKNPTFSPASINPIGQVDLSGSIPALAIQPGADSNTAAIAVPPRDGVSTSATIYLFNASTGASTGTVTFSLETATRKIDPTKSISIPAISIDPCSNLLFAGELANAKLLYAVPFGSNAGPAVALDPQTQNGTVGNLTYEPFSKTLIAYSSDLQNPTFSGFQVSMPAAPVFTQRGKTGAARWTPPTALVPQFVVPQNPANEPCTN